MNKNLMQKINEIVNKSAIEWNQAMDDPEKKQAYLDKLRQINDSANERRIELELAARQQNYMDRNIRYHG